MPQTLCLNMIVKNEARVIRRCLETVKPYIHTWVIVDTGSTDGTQNVIRHELRGLPGELHERPWVDFGFNRTEALHLARGKADYLLIIDADEIMIPEDGFAMPQLQADAYQILHIPGESTTTFFLTQLVRGDLPFRYLGVLHEGIHCDVPHRTVRLTGIATKGFFDSARNADPLRKYENDAAVLERAILAEPNNARYVFYLAQSYRDCRQLEKSVEMYERRATMGGWGEEVYYALYQSGVLRERLGQSTGKVVDAYLRAYQARPQRAEAVCEIAKHLRQKAMYRAAYLFATVAAKIPKPDDVLFLDESVYAWRSSDELAVCSYYTGKTADARAITERVIATADLSATERMRMEKNLRYYREDLGGPRRTILAELEERSG